MLRILSRRQFQFRSTLQMFALRAAHTDGPEPGSKEFNAQYTKLFMRWDIDGWEARQAMNNLAGMDLVPHPDVIAAGLRACRQLNDFALAIRWLEVCKNKCGDEVKILYPYLLRRIRPTMEELGVPTLEEMCYDKPQLALESVDDM